LADVLFDETQLTNAHPSGIFISLT